MKRFSQIPIVALALIMMATIASAQHLISSKAGFVNRAEGKVFILRHDSENGERGRVSLGTQMRDGDRILTEADSRTELLLSPGSYLRLNENSEVRAVSTSFMQMRFELVKGSVITEVSTSTEQVSTINKNNPVELITPHGTVSIAKDGLFRFDMAQATTLVQVRQGEFALGAREQFLSGKASKIGRGKAIRLDGRNAAKDDVAKIDKDVADQFDVWSFGRAQTLMAANLSALRRSRTTSAMSYGWIYDSFYNCYTFIPGRGLYYSPYGFGFFNSFGSMYGYYPYGYYPYYPSNGYGYGGGVVTPNIPPRVVSGNDRTPIRRETEGRRVDSSSSFGDRGDYGSSRSISTSSSSVYAPISVSAPAPTRSDSGDGGRAPAPTRP
ncbi:MAG: FecR domain-containing protein [Acidobacteriota bacterium]|nr:FecR domain-containing protein [Acidobacteriota bacterium]